MSSVKQVEQVFVFFSLPKRGQIDAELMFVGKEIFYKSVLHGCLRSRKKSVGSSIASAAWVKSINGAL